jgi:hypothetical protein
MAPIDKTHYHITRRCEVMPQGQHAATHYEWLAEFKSKDSMLWILWILLIHDEYDDSILLPQWIIIYDHLIEKLRETGIAFLYRITQGDMFEGRDSPAIFQLRR